MKIKIEIEVETNRVAGKREIENRLHEVIIGYGENSLWEKLLKNWMQKQSEIKFTTVCIHDIKDISNDPTHLKIEIEAETNKAAEKHEIEFRLSEAIIVGCIKNNRLKRLLKNWMQKQSEIEFTMVCIHAIKDI